MDSLSFLANLVVCFYLKISCIRVKEYLVSDSFRNFKLSGQLVLIIHFKFWKVANICFQSPGNGSTSCSHSLL